MRKLLYEMRICQKSRNKVTKTVYVFFRIFMDQTLVMQRLQSPKKVWFQKRETDKMPTKVRLEQAPPKVGREVMPPKNGQQRMPPITTENQCFQKLARNHCPQSIGRNECPSTENYTTLRTLQGRSRPFVVGSVRLSVLPCQCPSSSSHRLVSGTILCNEKEEASLTLVRPRKQAEAAILLASPTMKVFRLKPGDFPFYKQVSRYVCPSRSMCDERPPLLAV